MALKAGATDYQASPKGLTKARTKSASASPTKRGKCYDLRFSNMILIQNIATNSGRVAKKKSSTPSKIELETFANNLDFELDVDGDDYNEVV